MYMLGMLMCLVVGYGSDVRQRAWVVVSVLEMGKRITQGRWMSIEIWRRTLIEGKKKVGMMTEFLDWRIGSVLVWVPRPSAPHIMHILSQQSD